jgi:type I restriction enzyme S subunit
VSECFDLPDRWAIASLADICLKIVDGSHNPPSAQSNGLPMLSAKNIYDGRIEFDGRLIAPDAFEQEDRRTRVKPGDVLLTIVGTIGRSAVVPIGVGPFTLQRSVAVLKPCLVEPRFLMHQLQAPHIRRLLAVEARGTAQKGVYLNSLGLIRLRVATLREQIRIADALDELLSDLDAGTAALERVREKLKLYRVSVLKAAVEGTLTAEWRKQHPNVDSASELLKRILAERRRRWEEGQLRKFKEEGQDPPKNWRTKYEEPVPVNETKFPALPHGWRWVSLAHLTPFSRGSVKTGPFGSLLKKHEHTSTGVPVLGIENIGRMRFIQGSKIHITKSKAHDLAEYDAVPGDILISRSGTVGEVCVVPQNVGEARISTNLMRVRLFEPAMDPRFFCLLFNGCPSVVQQVSELCSGSTRDFLNHHILASLRFPLPPRLEQDAIIEAIEDQLSIIEHLEADIDSRRENAQALRQSILRHAFTGKLVPQNPKDEPATELLKRIAAAREARASETSATRHATKKINSARRRPPVKKKQKEQAD